MARNPTITSNTAGVAVKTGAKGLGAFGWTMLGASIALAFVPIVGGGLAHVVDRFRNGMEAKDEKKTLTNWYRYQIASVLNIPPDQVTYKDLELAAQINPTLGQMVDKIETEESKHNKASMIGGAFATFVPVLGGGIKAGGIAMGATFTPYMFGGDHIVMDEVATHINEKRQNGEQIEMGDVFMLRLAHDRELQETISKQHGAKFHKMTPEQQQGVMMQMPEMMQAAQREAYALNQGLISEQDLVMATNAAPQASFANKVQPRAAQTSFRAREEARRAQAAQMQQQLA